MLFWSAFGASIDILHIRIDNASDNQALEMLFSLLQQVKHIIRHRRPLMMILICIRWIHLFQGKLFSSREDQRRRRLTMDIGSERGLICSLKTFSFLSLIDLLYSTAGYHTFFSSLSESYANFTLLDTVQS